MPPRGGGFISSLFVWIAPMSEHANGRLFALVRLARWPLLGLAILIVILVGYRLFKPVPVEPVAPIAGAPGADAITRGEYLARAADCGACHTAAQGRPFAGGRPFATPFGTLYSTNISADTSHGIGSWSDEEFIKAVRQGIGREGNLYPAMPFTSYSAMSRDDVLAIKAYLLSLPAVSQANRANGIGFPFNQRWGLKAWNLAFLSDRRFAPDDSQSADWNRGAYLTTALGHCGECHTPRNLGFAMSTGKAFSGTLIEGWLAPNLTSDRQAGLGDWSDQQLLGYLASGHAPGRSSASGPMAEVIERSLQYLNQADVRAMALYLRSLPARPGAAANIALAPAAAVGSGPVLPQPAAQPLDSGARLFAGDCAGCHQWNGKGRQSVYADLLGTRSVNDPQGNSVVQVILSGTQLTVGNQRVEMPGFAAKYSDAQVAALANYVISHFGEKTASVTGDEVAAQRQASQ
jgi:mono/diheme cytochrome c family protein